MEVPACCLCGGKKKITLLRQVNHQSSSLPFLHYHLLSVCSLSLSVHLPPPPFNTKQSRLDMCDGPSSSWVSSSQTNNPPLSPLLITLLSRYDLQEASSHCTSLALCPSMTVFIKRIRIGGGLAKATVEILNWWFHKGEKGYPSLAATSCLMSQNPSFKQDFHCSPDDVGLTLSQSIIMLLFNSFDRNRFKIHKDKIVD